MDKDKPSANQLQLDLSLNKWQKNMQPLMKQLIVGLALFFFIASCAQLFYLHRTIEQSPKLDLEKYISTFSAGKPLSSTKHEKLKFYTLILLENNALERRHHQANVLLMSRVWVRYLGFVTGMILAMVGAIFILGKLQEPSTELGAKSNVTEINLKSSSPGIILTALGVVLMLTTILTHHEIEVRDLAVYTRNIIQSNEIIDDEKPNLDAL